MIKVVHKTSGKVIGYYTDESTARRIMRLYNKSAGWSRISRSWTGSLELEWCSKQGRVPGFNYGPYVIKYD